MNEKVKQFLAGCIWYYFYFDEHNDFHQNPKLMPKELFIENAYNGWNKHISCQYALVCVGLRLIKCFQEGLVLTKTFTEVSDLEMIVEYFRDSFDEFVKINPKYKELNALIQDLPPYKVSENIEWCKALIELITNELSLSVIGENK